MFVYECCKIYVRSFSAYAPLQLNVQDVVIRRQNLIENLLSFLNRVFDFNINITVCAVGYALCQNQTFGVYG